MKNDGILHFNTPKMTSILRFTLLGALFYSSCTAFMPLNRAHVAKRPTLSSSSLFVSSSASSRHQHLTNSTSGTSFAVYHDDEHATTTHVDPKDFFQSHGQGLEQLQQIQALEKLVQAPSDVHSPPHVEEQASTTTTTVVEQPQEEESGLLSTVWNARLLLLGAAALYGTNFSVIKIMGDTMPVGISATLRFGLAALATLPWLVQPPKDGSTLLEEFTSETTNKNKKKNVWDTVVSLSQTTTVGAALAGFEVGLWNSVGYLAQAVGLATTDASKVC